MFKKNQTCNISSTARASATACCGAVKFTVLKICVLITAYKFNSLQSNKSTV